MKIDKSKFVFAAKTIAQEEIKKSTINNINNEDIKEIESAALEGLTESLTLLDYDSNYIKFSEKWSWYVRQSVLSKIAQINIFKKFVFFTNFSLSYHGHYSIDLKFGKLIYSLPVYITFNQIYVLLAKEGIDYNQLNPIDWWKIKFKKAKIKLF